MNWNNIIGQKIVALRGYNKKELHFILLDDGETYIDFIEQDKYDFHDYSFSARNIYICKNSETWENMLNKVGRYVEVTEFTGF